jgi:hypothetical protein
VDIATDNRQRRPRDPSRCRKNAPEQGGRTACAASFILCVHTLFSLPFSYADLSVLHGAMHHSNRLLLANC